MYAHSSEIPAGKNCVGRDLSDFEVIQVKMCRDMKKRRFESQWNSHGAFPPKQIATEQEQFVSQGTGGYGYATLTRVSLRTSKDI